jgi:hypothetical protein
MPPVEGVVIVVSFEVYRLLFASPSLPGMKSRKDEELIGGLVRGPAL